MSDTHNYAHKKAHHERAGSPALRLMSAKEGKRGGEHSSPHLKGIRSRAEEEMRHHDEAHSKKHHDHRDNFYGHGHCEKAQDDHKKHYATGGMPMASTANYNPSSYKDGGTPKMKHRAEGGSMPSTQGGADTAIMKKGGHMQHFAEGGVGKLRKGYPNTLESR